MGTPVISVFLWLILIPILFVVFIIALDNAFTNYIDCIIAGIFALIINVFVLVPLFNNTFLGQITIPRSMHDQAQELSFTLTVMLGYWVGKKVVKKRSKDKEAAQE